MQELSVRLDAASFELRTFDPDYNDDGVPQDFGKTLIVGQVVSEEFNDQLAVQLERAPEIASLLAALEREGVLSAARPGLQADVRTILEAIKNGKLRYDPMH